eukprot:TRINITY_DN49463_c0_g1_i1.p1 TRINITY_DN49463_c0_g1~~TRINITY_DN49463_c0_g1_i1.p1  ORF type:complete len:201 (-),score=36.84 TRINITY_DN49463_c0_g1_i1:140-721(-)
MASLSAHCVGHCNRCTNLSRLRCYLLFPLLALLAASASTFSAESISGGCRMPVVKWSPPAGSCLEARGFGPNFLIPDGGSCTPWCALGFRVATDASEPKLHCSRGSLSPADFRCKRAVDGASAANVGAGFGAGAGTVAAMPPEALPISRCLEDFDFCEPKRLKYATHLAQAGNWEAIDDSSWRPKWPPNSQER